MYETRYQLKEKNCEKYKHMQAKKEITEEIKKYLETDDNENKTTQNLWMPQKQF